MGMIIPWNDPRNLSEDSSVTVSPFTIVFEAAGLSSVAHIMNAVILITVSYIYIEDSLQITHFFKPIVQVLSCANSGMYVSSRMLCALSKEGLAHPKLCKLHQLQSILKSENVLT